MRRRLPRAPAWPAAVFCSPCRRCMRWESAARQYSRTCSMLALASAATTGCGGWGAGYALAGIAALAAGADPARVRRERPVRHLPQRCRRPLSRVAHGRPLLRAARRGRAALRTSPESLRRWSVVRAGPVGVGAGRCRSAESRGGRRSLRTAVPTGGRRPGHLRSGRGCSVDCGRRPKAHVAGGVDQRQPGPRGLRPPARVRGTGLLRSGMVGERCAANSQFRATRQRIS